MRHKKERFRDILYLELSLGCCTRRIERDLSGVDRIDQGVGTFRVCVCQTNLADSKVETYTDHTDPLRTGSEYDVLAIPGTCMKKTPYPDDHYL